MKLKVHFPGHIRSAFRDLVAGWAEAGEPPAVAKFEEGYFPKEGRLDEFLWTFRLCEDLLPGETRTLVEQITNTHKGQIETYGQAAIALEVAAARSNLPGLAAEAFERAGRTPDELTRFVQAVERYL